MIDKQIAETLDLLNRTTGHYTWTWDEKDSYHTAPLSDDLTALLVNDIESLDCKVSQRPHAEGTELVMALDEAINFIEREAKDRIHVAPPARDLELEYLSTHHPKFIWRPRDEGFVGYGYTLSQEAELIKPFKRERIHLEPTEAETNHDGATHGLFVARSDVARLMQRTQEIAR